MPAVIEDFDAIEEAVRDSSRGRWFLEEHAKRVRRQETATLLQAMDRLEHAVTSANDRLAERLSLALGLKPAPGTKQHWQDDDIFEAPGTSATITAFPVTPRMEAAAKSRIVIIRHKPGERIDVPLHDGR